MKHKIGTNFISYLQSRNFTSLPYKSYSFDKGYDLCKLFNHGYYLATGKNSIYLNNAHFLQVATRLNLYHFFNTISFSNAPWITSFEFYLPRWGIINGNRKLINAGLERLLNPSCRKLIAISEFAYNSQRIFTNEHTPDITNELMKKIEIIPPAQELFINNINKKSTNKNYISFVMVGADFFRKGGKEVLAAFERLLTKKKYPIKLVIVSSLQWGDYASKSTILDLELVKSIIKRFPENITYHASLENSEVIQLLLRSDAAFLPSYDETYGFFVLEAQSCGCPVITTNGGVFPEINSDSCGWIIDCKKTDKWGRVFPKNESDRISFSEYLTDRLEHIISSISENPETIRQKGACCLNRISQQHNILDTTIKIESIYDEIFNQ